VVEAALRGVPGSVVASTGQTLIVPAATVVTLVAGTQAALLRGWVPDLVQDIVEPARVAGLMDADLVQIGMEALVL
jgi:hypothetical protein